MLSYEECLDMCDLTEDEVSAIAEHEHMDPMLALALGQYLITHEGEIKIRKIILDDIDRAIKANNHSHEAFLRQVLEHFIKTHPVHKLNKMAAA